MSDGQERTHSQADGPGSDDDAVVRNNSAPFDSSLEGADCILRSSDNVDLYVHKLVLSLASPFFKSMFSLPKPGDHETGDVKDGLPVIAIPEPFDTIHSLLQLCYPCPPMNLKELHDFHKLIRIFDAADKYDVDGMLKYLEETLLEIAPTNPIAAYAVGCRHSSPSLILAGAKASLNKPFAELGYSLELERITGAQLQKLHTYHIQCKKAASAVCSPEDPSSLHWIKNINDLPCASESRRCPCHIVLPFSFGPPMPRRVFGPPWLLEYMFAMTSRLRDIPRGNVVTSETALNLALYTSDHPESTFCGMSAKYELNQFAQLLSAEVEVAVTNVS